MKTELYFKNANVKDESSDESFRCGRIRSSDESTVMVTERRDSVIYTSKIEQPEMGGFYAGRKIVSNFKTSNTVCSASFSALKACKNAIFVFSDGLFWVIIVVCTFLV